MLLLALKVPKLQCNATTGAPCAYGISSNLVKGHGVETGRCVLSPRDLTTHVCEIQSWCPVEVDELPLGRDEGPLIPGKKRFDAFKKPDSG